MKLVHKAEVRLVDDADNSKSKFLSSRVITVDVEDAAKASDLCAASYAKLVEDKDFDAEKFEKFKEEVTKPGKKDALAADDKLFGEGFWEGGKIVVYTVYAKNKVVAPLEGNDAYKAAAKVKMLARKPAKA